MDLPLPNVMRLVVLCVVAALLSGCGGRPDTGALAIATTTAPGAEERRILVATTREKDETPHTYFSGERSSTLSYASAVVSVPPDHVSGKIEWPDSVPGDPSKHFTVRSIGHLDGEPGFKAALRQEFAKRKPEHREVFLFIHGYNTRFPEALYRFAQVLHDANSPRVPVLFTWASRGSVTDYVYDNNSATAARDGLEKTVRDIIAAGATKVHILAHSMGNWLLMETIRQVRLSGKPIDADKIGVVVLAAPDLDIDVFKSQLRAIGRLKKPLILLVSRDDKALRASSIIAGGKQRVGAYENEKELAELGVVVVDLTDLEGLSATNHAKFAEVEAVAPALEEVLMKTGFERRNESFGTRANGLGEAVGNTAKIAITLPIRVLTAPITVLSGSQ